MRPPFSLVGGRMKISIWERIALVAVPLFAFIVWVFLCYFLVSAKLVLLPVQAHERGPEVTVTKVEFPMPCSEGMRTIGDAVEATGMQQIFAGVTTAKGLMILLVDPVDGHWTAVLSIPNGDISCIVLVGEGYVSREAEEDALGDPSSYRP